MERIIEAGRKLIGIGAGTGAAEATKSTRPAPATRPGYPEASTFEDPDMKAGAARHRERVARFGGDLLGDAGAKAELDHMHGGSSDDSGLEMAAFKTFKEHLAETGNDGLNFIQSNIYSSAPAESELVGNINALTYSDDKDMISIAVGAALSGNSGILRGMQEEASKHPDGVQARALASSKILLMHALNESSELMAKSKSHLENISSSAHQLKDQIAFARRNHAEAKALVWMYEGAFEKISHN